MSTDPDLDKHLHRLTDREIAAATAILTAEMRQRRSAARRRNFESARVLLPILLIVARALAFGAGLSLFWFAGWQFGLAATLMLLGYGLDSPTNHQSTNPPKDGTR